MPASERAQSRLRKGAPLDVGEGASGEAGPSSHRNLGKAAAKGLHLPSLVLALLSLGLLLGMMLRSYPEDLRDFFIPQSYLPVSFFFFLACGFFSASFTRSVGPSFAFASWLTLTILLFLQGPLDYSVLLSLAGLLILSQFLAHFLKGS